MRSHKRLWLIVGVLALVAIWIASGALFREESAEQSATVGEGGATTVAVRHSQAEPIERLLVLQGDVQPDQVVNIRAETAGQIQSWQVPRGAAVKKGDLLAVVELGERQSQLRQAQARLKVARQQLRATRQLVEEGYEPDIQADTAEAELEAAEAEMAAIEQDISRTRIRAPIPGQVNQRFAETGDFVAAGGQVAQLVNNNPLLATVQVPQHRVTNLEVGQPARVTVLGHGQAEGHISFVSSLADPATRTFRVEIELPNPDQRLPAGTSIEAEIPIAEVQAHKVSPALVSLNDDGQIGVKTVNSDGVVEFHPTTVVRAQRDGLWVTGLPEETHIITVGQGFVSAGEQVEMRSEDAIDGQRTSQANVEMGADIEAEEAGASEEAETPPQGAGS